MMRPILLERGTVFRRVLSRRFVAYACSQEAAAVEAAYIGNLVASITVTKIGRTGTASPTEILERHRSLMNL